MVYTLTGLRREVWVSDHKGRLDLYLLNYPQPVSAFLLAVRLNESLRQARNAPLKRRRAQEPSKA